MTHPPESTPLAVDVKPSQLVGAVVAAVDMNGPILRPRRTPRDLSLADVRFLRDAPAKFPSVLMILQKLQEPLLRQFGFRHRGLK